jgi:hypothetical protein
MRRLFVLLAAGMLAAGLLTTASSAATKSAHAVACASQVPAGNGRFGGVVSAQSIARSCSAHNTSDAANGVPPLLYWGGPVMGTDSTGPITVTPIFWDPTAHPMSSNYMNLITRYLGDVATVSGADSNVYSTATEYYGTNGSINYDMVAGAPIDDQNRLPQSSCTVMQRDRSKIYMDGSGYFACLDDAQVTAEIQRVIDARGLPQSDYSHIYALFLPKGVESCFYGGKTANKFNVCTINHYKSAGYCAYHSMMGDNWPDFGTVYANMPYPIYASPVGYTCGSDAGGFLGGLQSPNHNLDADTEISPTSHEVMESITDPNVFNGWFDAAGYENGDECAYVWGPTAGDQGGLYNQVINTHDYLTQEEFSNLDFAGTGLGCVQSESAVTPPQ